MIVLGFINEAILSITIFERNLWWYIAKANHLRFMTLEPGTSLRIPTTTQYAIGK